MKLKAYYFGLAILGCALPCTAQTTIPQNKAVPQTAPARTTQSLIQEALRYLRTESGPLPRTPEQKAKEDAQHDRMNELDQDGTQALHTKNFVLAEADYRQLIQDNAPGPFAHYGLGEALAGQGKTAEALAAYKTAVYWPLNTPEGQTALSQSGINKPNLRGCCCGTDAVAWLKYAVLLSQTGQNAEAFSVYSQAIRWVHDVEGSGITLFPSTNSPSSSQLQAAEHIALGLLTGGMLTDHKQAMVEFNQALQLEPSSSVANYYCGYGLKWLGRHSESQAAFQKAAAMDNGEVRAAATKALKDAG
jgi:tetratricopeptide (TPR) repeat protein